MTISTSCPRVLRKRIRRSVENPLSFPRTRSETSACVTCRTSAAFTWVRPRFSIVAAMRAAISALASASPLSGTPRSLNTFPELLRTEITFLASFVALLIIYLEGFRIWMFDARLREVERESHDVLHVLRKPAEVLLRRPHPEQGL